MASSKRATDRRSGELEVIAELIATARLNDVEPYDYLKDVLERMSDGHPASQLDQLLPWNWRAQNSVNH